MNRKKLILGYGHYGNQTSAYIREDRLVTPDITKEEKESIADMFSIDDLELTLVDIKDPPTVNPANNVKIIKSDMIKFLENTSEKYDYIVMDNVIEHVKWTDIPYLLYLLKTVGYGNHTKLLIVSPDFNYYVTKYKKLDGIKSLDDITLLTKMHAAILNERSDPHCSLWSDELAEYYFNENLWKKIISTTSIHGEYVGLYILNS